MPNPQIEETVQPVVSARKKRLFLIDGYGFVFRAFHALPPIRTSKGVPTGAVYGFVNMLMKLKTTVENDDSESYMAVVFDSGKKTFRDDIYSEYKANRLEAPDDLKTQFPLIRRAAEAMNIPAAEAENYEADDLIATYTKAARAQGLEVTIVSSDKDLMQLITEGVKMFDPVKSAEIGEKEVLAKFGVLPGKVAEVLALIGDSSDNIPGVRGIGPKTAAELINEYGTVENLLENIHNIKQQKRAEMLRENSEKARLSKQLVLLHYDVPLPKEISSFAYQANDNQKLFNFFSEMEFRSLLARLEKKMPGLIPAKPEMPIEQNLITSPEVTENNFVLVKEKAELYAWLNEVRIVKDMVISLEVIEKNKLGLLIGYQQNLNKYLGCFVPFGSEEAKQQIGLDLLEEKNISSSLSAGEVFSVLKPWLEDNSILKIGHNIKDLHYFSDNAEIKLEPVDDVMLMSNVLDSTKHRHDFATLAKVHLQIDIDSNSSNQSNILEEKSKVIYNLHKILRQRLFREKMLRVYEVLERPLIEVLAEMERVGVLVDKTELARLSEYFNQSLRKLEADIYRLAGQEFNIGSPKQLSEVLFGSMGFAGGKKLKSGAFTTGAGALEQLAEEGQEIAAKILQWRQFSKLKSTYTDALITQISPRDGRVHTNYAMAATSTGRLSSINPNLQNIPIKSEEGRKIRRAFIAAPGNKLVAADYSQVELRLLAHMADLPILREAFSKGQDIHNITAAQVFGVPVDKVDANIRRMAKTINFGIIYGQSAFGLARQLGISRQDAGTYIKAYFEKYPGILEYMERTKQFARETGYVATLFGRKCHILGMNDRNQGIRGNAERAAINAPLQGTAADIIKRAMIQIHQRFREENLKAKIIVQVHDELIFEAPENEVETLSGIAKKIMENVVMLSVPLTVDVKKGDNWGEIH